MRVGSEDKEEKEGVKNIGEEMRWRGQHDAQGR